MRRRRLLFIAAWLLLTTAGAEAVEPAKQEAVVYRLRSWTAEEYAEVFAPPQASTIYIVASVDNAFDARYTQVYFWPLSQEYFVSWESLDEAAAGHLEVLRAGRVIRQLERQAVCFRYDSASATGPSTLAAGEKALAMHARYSREDAEYERSLTEYSRSMLRYQQELRAYMRRSRESQGGSAEPPVEPREPAPPAWFVTAPSDAFVLDLPAGEYRIRLRDEGGDIVEGSERRLVAFQAAGPDGVGYQVFSEDRWTAALSSASTESDIYCAADAVAYLTAFTTSQYYEDEYTRVRNPQAADVPRRITHVFTRPIDGARLVVGRMNGPAARIERRPYYVRQLEGADLGYQILDWNPQTAGKDSPTFSGYFLKAAALGLGPGAEVWLEDDAGRPLPGSRRALRLGQKRLPLAVWLLPLLPLAAAAGVLISRGKGRAKLE